MEARQQVGRDRECQRHRAQPVAQRHRRDGQRRQHVVPGPPFGERDVEQRDGQRKQAQGREVRTLPVDDQRVQPPPGEPAARIVSAPPSPAGTPARSANSRRRPPARGAIAAQPPRHPEERHRTQRVDRRGHEVVRQAGRNVRWPPRPGRTPGAGAADTYRRTECRRTTAGTRRALPGGWRCSAPDRCTPPRSSPSAACNPCGTGAA